MRLSYKLKYRSAYLSHSHLKIPSFSLSCHLASSTVIVFRSIYKIAGMILQNTYTTVQNNTHACPSSFYSYIDTSINRIVNYPTEHIRSDGQTDGQGSAALANATERRLGVARSRPEGRSLA